MKPILPLAFSLVVWTACVNPKEQSSTPKRSSYELARDWLKLPSSAVLGNPTGIGVDREQNIFVFHRAGREWPAIGPMPESFIQRPTIFQIHSASGQLMNSWGQGLFRMPHGLTLDADDHVWLTDVALHQVFKFTKEGKRLMTLGVAGIAGNDSAHFNLPTDVAVAPDGSVYVSDGYGNSRVVKFSPDGKYILQWGSKGKAKGEFDIPHSIDTDAEGKVYVADRENNRIQVFDGDGKFLREIINSGGRIFSVDWEPGLQKLFAIDYHTGPLMVPVGSDILEFDQQLQIAERFGRTDNDKPCWYHDLAVDKSGNIYTGDIFGNRLHKYARKKDK